MKYTQGIALPAVIAIVALAIVGGGIAYVNMGSEETLMEEKGKTLMDKGEEMKHEGEALMKDGEKMIDEAGVMDPKAADDVRAMEDPIILSGDNAGGEEDVMEEESSFTGTLLAGDSAPLLEFNQADYEIAKADGKLVMLFFFAEWCPNCHAEFVHTQEAFDALERDDVVGFRVHFKDNVTTDEHTALAREFGVAYQHTKVFIKDGEQLLKSPESWDEARYISEIGKL